MTGPTEPPPQPLREPGFRMFLAGQSFSLFGDGMVNVALAFAALEVGGSASDIGVVFGARTFALVASLLIGGVVADRMSRRYVLMTADVIRLCSQGMTAALLVGGAAELWSLALLAGVAGAATGFFNPAAAGLIPALVPAEALQRANGMLSTAFAGGNVLGPMIAGVLVAAVGPGWALGVDAATFAVSAAFLLLLRPREVAAAAPAAPFLQDFRRGWQEFRSRTWLWSFVLAVAIGNVSWGAWLVLGPIVAERDFDGATAWGLIMSGFGIGGIVGGLAALRLRPTRPLVTAAIAMSMLAIPIALLALRAPILLLAASAMVAGAGMLMANAVWDTTLQREIPSASLSRVSSYDWFCSLALEPLSLPAWGWVAVALGVTTSLWVAVALQALALAAILAVPEVRRIRAGHVARQPARQASHRPAD